MNLVPNGAARVSCKGRAWMTYAGAEHGPAETALQKAALVCAILSGGKSALPAGATSEAVQTETAHSHMSAVRIEEPMLAAHGVALGDAWPERAWTATEAIQAGWALTRLAAKALSDRGPLESIRVELGPSRVGLPMGTSRVSHANGWLEFNLSGNGLRGGAKSHITLPSGIQTALAAVTIGATLAGGPDLGQILYIDLGASASARAAVRARLLEGEEDDRATVAGFMDAVGAGAWAGPFAKRCA